MAVIHRDHLSLETGHTTGASRVLLGVGLVLVVVGVLVFAGAVVWGIFDARNGSAVSSDSLRFLPLGGGSIVVGTLLAAAGMTLGRRMAGE